MVPPLVRVSHSEDPTGYDHFFTFFDDSRSPTAVGVQTNLPPEFLSEVFRGRVCLFPGVFDTKYKPRITLLGTAARNWAELSLCLFGTPFFADTAGGNRFMDFAASNYGDGPFYRSLNPTRLVGCDLGPFPIFVDEQNFGRDDERHFVVNAELVDLGTLRVMEVGGPLINSPFLAVVYQLQSQSSKQTYPIVGLL